MRKIIFSLILLFLVISSQAYCEQPLEIIKERIEQIVSILNDQQYMAPGQDVLRKEKISAIARDIFDFTEISKRALAWNWRNFTPLERKEFTDAFTELIKNTYLNKIKNQHQHIKVIYLGQEMISKTKAKVKTRIQRENVDILVCYKVKIRKGLWKIYDVSAEGVSLIKNYRIQFNKILLKESPSQLIDKIKAKNRQPKNGKAVVDSAKELFLIVENIYWLI